MSWSKAGKIGENLGQSIGHENKDKWVGLESVSEMTGPEVEYKGGEERRRKENN